VTHRIVTRRSVAAEIGSLLNSPEVSALIAELEALRWTGRKGYPIRSLVGACLVKSLYAIPTWTRTAALIAEHAALREALGAAPSVFACYRFTTKLREHSGALADCLDRIVAGLRDEVPDYGVDVAVDGSDLPAFANGQRFVKKGGPLRERYSDPEATWGHRSAVSTRSGGSFYGWKIHAAVCARTDLPLVWRIETAKASELSALEPLLDAVGARGFRPETVIGDTGYDYAPGHETVMEHGAVPVFARRRFAGEGDWTEAPECEHGVWTFAGASYDRRATQWRCPTGECSPKSVRVRADRRHPLIPRSTRRFGQMFAKRGCVERAFGRLKHEYGLGPLRVRGRERVALHADLTVLALLASRLAQERARAVPLAA
jgi:transposase, IS5 family